MSAKGFGSKLNKDVSRETSGIGKKAGAGFGKAFALGAGVIAAAGIGKFLKDSVGEAREAQKVGAATESIIKATGGAANLTAKQVGDLSGALSNRIGVDDEAIQSGANLLLTFKNVRNEVGKGNDVFARATKAGADLAAAGFGSISGNALQLGKALNDPIKGISALGRAGVTFTEAQKKQIKGFVASNDLLSAQKIILGEVEHQVGGTAEATATAGEKSAVAFGNLKEQIGTALVPVLDKLQGIFANKIAPAISLFVSQMQNGTGAGGTFRDILVGLYKKVLQPLGSFIFGTFVPAIGQLIVGFRDGTGLGGKFAEFFRGLLDILRPVGRFIIDTVVPAIRDFIAGMNDGTGAGGKYVEIVSRIYSALRSAADFIFSNVVPAIAGFIGGMRDGTGAGGGFADAIGKIRDFVVNRLVPAISGVVDAIRDFVKKALPIAIEFVTAMQAKLTPLIPKIKAIFKQIGDIIISALGFIKTVINTAITVIQFIWKNFGSTIVNFVAGAFSAIATIIGGALKIIQGIIKVATSLLKGDWSGVWNGFKMIVSGAWSVIKGIISGALTVVKAILSAAWTVIKGGVSAAWNAIKRVILGIVGAIKTDVGRKIDAIKTAFGKLGDLVGKAKEIFGDVLEAIKVKFRDAVAYVKGVPGKFTDALAGLYEIGKDAAVKLGQGIIDGITGKLKEVKDAIGKMASAIKDKFPGSPVKSGPLKSWNHGGGVSGAGRKLGQGIADGILAKRKAVIAAITKVADGIKATIDKIKSQISSVKDTMRTLASSVADAFKPDLFGGNLADLFTNGSKGTLNLKRLKAAFLKLRKFGLSPKFLSGLFASGNTDLILQLAESGKSSARSAQSLFNQTNSLSSQLGNAVGTNQFGDELRGLRGDLRDEMQKLRLEVAKMPKALGKEINGAATNGRRKTRV